MQSTVFCAIVVMMLLTTALYGACPPLQQGELLGRATGAGSLPHISEECLCEAMAGSKERAGVIIPEFEKYCATRGVSDTLLFCAFRTAALRKNQSLFGAVVHCWKEHHKSTVSVVQQYIESGKMREADTLCSILDIAGGAEPALLMRWIDVKVVLDDVEGVPALLCRIVEERPGLLPLALNKFTQMLEEVETARAVVLLGTFSHGIRVESHGDSSEIMMWLLEQFGQKKAYAEQIRTVNRFETSAENRSEILRLIALRYSEAGLHEIAISVADSAYASATTASQRQECAALLFKEYTGLGKEERAKVWLERSVGIKQSVETRTGAVALYQNSGLFDSAAKYLILLPDSRARDTLTIRQWLFRDSVQRAFAEVCSLQFLPDGFSGTLLWKLRCALFAARFDVASELVGALSPPEAALLPAEVTGYRYWLLRLMEEPEELAKFSQIQYTLFKGNRSKASKLVCSSPQRSKNRWRLALYVAQMQMAQGEVADALQTLGCAPAEGEPEYLTVLAEVNLRKGEVETAKSAAQKVLTLFPASPHAAKARLLLVQIAKKHALEE